MPPERMAPDQRRAEVAALLALGLVRLREHNARRSMGLDLERAGWTLAFAGRRTPVARHAGIRLGEIAAGDCQE